MSRSVHTYQLIQPVSVWSSSRIVVTCAPGRCQQHPVAIWRLNVKRAHCLHGCLAAWRRTRLRVELRRPSSSTAAQVMCDPLVLHASQIEQDYPFGGGGNELSFGINRAVPRGPYFPVCPRRRKKHADATVSRLVPVSHLPPSLLSKNSVSHREIPRAHPVSHPISILGRGRRSGEAACCCCYCHTAASIL